jgi:hypothetical protein
MLCWIEGLKLSADGQMTNAMDPIDYEHCKFKSAMPRKGRCSPTGGSAEGIFAGSCGGTGCHIGVANPGGMLDLSTGKALASLVGKPSTGADGETLVVPGDPDKSYLLCKLSATCDRRKGERMPKDSPALSDETVMTLRAWIASGAL